MGEPEDFGLPKDAKELNIIRGHKLAPSFSTYAEDSEGKIESEQVASLRGQSSSGTAASTNSQSGRQEGQACGRAWPSLFC
jgi:hypothetical protein